MKRTIIITFALAGIAVLQGIAKDKKKKEVLYEFPPEMAAPVQVEYAKICDKGQILYDLNCANCHNTKVKGQTVIPDFSQDQLKGYEMRVMNSKHEAELPDEKVTSEELGLITTFLIYKKKNAVAAK